jgi:hypothetical protein
MKVKGINLTEYNNEVISVWSGRKLVARAGVLEGFGFEISAGGIEA